MKSPVIYAGYKNVLLALPVIDEQFELRRVCVSCCTPSGLVVGVYHGYESNKHSSITNVVLGDKLSTGERVIRKIPVAIISRLDVHASF